MLLDEVRQFLRKNGVRLDTDLGQHVLIDEDVLQDIIAVADLQSSDHVVEIGPGIGILTRELLKHAAKVTAIEIDARLIPLLKEFARKPNANGHELIVIEGNALHEPMPTTPYKVVANIPYHITSPLLAHLLLGSAVRPMSVTLLIQREVAENICSTQSDSLLTILVRLYGKPSFIRCVSQRAFLPPPKVESAVLHIACFPQPRVDLHTVERILKIAKLAFSKRRKMLNNTLGKTPIGTEAMQAASIDPKRRPQTLTIDEWIALEAAIR